MYYGRFRYVKVVNKDGSSVTTKVVAKYFRYMSITPRLKRLYLSEETTKHMRWHKKGKHDCEDPDIMSHPAGTEAWEALNCFDPKFARHSKCVHLGLLTDSFQPHSEASIPYFC
jgi:hypothetical protein